MLLIRDVGRYQNNFGWCLKIAPQSELHACNSPMKRTKLSCLAGLGPAVILSRHTERILDSGGGRNRSVYRHGMAIDARKCDLSDSPLPVVRGCLKNLPVTVMPASLNDG